MTINAKVLGDPVRRFSGLNPLGNAVLKLRRDRRPPNVFSRSLCLRHASSGALTNLLRLNLGQRGQHGKQDIAD
jgi:hypothetical protein